MNIFKKLGVALALPIMLIMSGCSTVPHSPQVETTVKVPTLNAIFGGTVTYADGVSVSVSMPEEYIPTESASGAVEGYSNVTFTITVTNDSKEAIDIGGWPTVVSSGEDGSEIIDDVVGNHYAEEVKPGKSTSWKEAFSVKDPSDITLSYSAGVDKKDAIFKTK